MGFALIERRWGFAESLSVLYFFSFNIPNVIPICANEYVPITKRCDNGRSYLNLFMAKKLSEIKNSIAPINTNK